MPEKDKPVAFGMTRKEISETARKLSGYTDINHPKESGSYKDFIKIVTAGHKKLIAQKNLGTTGNLPL